MILYLSHQIFKIAIALVIILSFLATFKILIFVFFNFYLLVFSITLSKVQKYLSFSFHPFRFFLFFSV